MKKVLALTLVLVLALGMSTVAFAAVGKKIDRNTWDYEDNFHFVPGSGDNANMLTQDARADTVFEISNTNLLDTDKVAIAPSVKATSGATDNGDAGILKETLKKSEFDIRLKWSKGSQLFDEIDVDTDLSKVKISYAENVATVSDIDFKYTVYAVINGRSMSSGDEAPIVEGTYAPEAFDDNWEDDWFQFDGQNYVKPNVFVRNMEYSFSDDVSVWGRALKGVKYYGFAKDDVTDADQDLMIEHAAIVGVYHLSQINVKAVADYVTLNNADATLYVYDGNLNLLGRGDGKLDYSDTYYLAATELDVDTEEPIEDGGEEEPGYEPDNWDDNADGGGDDLYPENPHDNPGTGK